MVFSKSEQRSLDGTFGSGPYSPLGELPSEQFLAMTADLPIFVKFER
jgi:hypothetical protein